MSFTDGLRTHHTAAALDISGQLRGDVLYGGLSFIADQRMKAAADSALVPWSKLLGQKLPVSLGAAAPAIYQHVTHSPHCSRMVRYGDSFVDSLVIKSRYMPPQLNRIFTLPIL